jgi:MoxR-like ATPase
MQPQSARTTAFNSKTSPSSNVDSDVTSRIEALRRSVEGVIRGKPEVVTHALVALFSEGHLLIEDVPGVGKTMLGQALARSVAGTFRRIQFTSDLLPSDIIGVSIFNPTTSEFEFKPGPLFANVVLADEINRSTPKTQSALLEAMNESQATVDNSSHPLPEPFIVIATQNPIEHHGTYPLPESQLDRFLMRIRMGYPDENHEKEILRVQRLSHPIDEVQPVLSSNDVQEIQRQVRAVEVDPSLADYLVRLSAATRQSNDLALGVSPRGTLLLQRAAQAHALISGRSYLVPDDIKAVAMPVLAHRVVPRVRASSGAGRGQEADAILAELLETVLVPL